MEETVFDRSAQIVKRVASGGGESGVRPFCQPWNLDRHGLAR